MGTAPLLRAATASASNTTANPPAGSPSVRTNCVVSAARWPAKAETTTLPGAFSAGLGAGMSRPVTQESTYPTPTTAVATRMRLGRAKVSPRATETVSIAMLSLSSPDS